MLQDRRQSPLQENNYNDNRIRVLEEKIEELLSGKGVVSVMGGFRSAASVHEVRSWIENKCKTLKTFKCNLFPLQGSIRLSKHHYIPIV